MKSPDSARDPVMTGPITPDPAVDFEGSPLSRNWDLDYIRRASPPLTINAAAKVASR
jgi:hypothetical protein